MALLNFLYKDESLVASLYAQIFQGRLMQVNHEETDKQQNGSEVGASLKVVSGKTEYENSFQKSRREVIDPHDAATLDVLKHLQGYAADEHSSKPGNIVLLAGGLFLVPYAHRKALLDFGFDANRPTFDKALVANIKDKKHRTRLIDLAKDSCIGEEDEIRFFFKSTAGVWYWGGLQKNNVTAHMSVLQITYGGNPIPMKLIAVHLGNTSPEIEEANEIPFARALHTMTAMSNTTLAGDACLTSALVPIALMQEIMAEPMEKTSLY